MAAAANRTAPEARPAAAGRGGLILPPLRRAALALARLARVADRRLQQNSVYLAAAVLLAALQLALIVTHTPWLDEVQGLLVAVQPDSLGGVAAQLRYEGHPMLWYLLLRGLAGILPHDWVLRGASLIVVALFWYAVLGTQRFSRAEKLLLLASELVLFEYGAVSRSLGLGVALVFLALHWWRRPAVWLPLALLPQCDFLFGVLSLMLLAVRWRDRPGSSARIAQVGLALWLASSLHAAVTVMPAADVVSDPPRPLLDQLIVFLSQIGTLAVPLQAGAGGLQWNQTLFPGILALPAFVALAAILPGKKLGARALTAGFIGFVAVFAAVVYPLYFRHVSLIAVWLIATYWLDESKAPHQRTAWRAWLVSMAGCGLVTAAANLVQPFDTARLFAERLRQQDLSQKALVAFPDWHAIAVSDAIGRPIGGLERGCASSFMRWNIKQMRPVRPGPFLAKLAAMEHRLGSFLLITPADLRLPASAGRPVFTTRAGFSGVSYALWEVGGAAPRRADLPPCVRSLPPQPIASGAPDLGKK